MRIVRANAHFFANVDEDVAQSRAQALQERIEAVVSEWLRDTGLWSAQVGVVIEARPDGQYNVEAEVGVDGFPFLVKP